MEEMCNGAIENGVSEIGFTDHYDLHHNEECRDYLKIDSWITELERVRAAFDGRLIIRAGIELGEPHIFQNEARAMLARYPFDYTLGSLHWVGEEHVFDPAYFKKRPPKEAFRLFFEELERMTRLGGFEILSHFDVIARTAYFVYGSYDPREHEACIRPVLKNCIERGIALDINTKGLRTKMGQLTPNEDILRWYVEMGGERVTLGSDAHDPHNVGAGCVQALHAAQAAGLKHLTYFEKRKAKLVPMELSVISEQ
jgi:histidinol-phosphatase (PHP family)